MHIAICDDEKFFLKDLEERIYRIIPRLDCTVEPFIRADDLLEVISSGKSYDMIFLDIEMDGTDGMTAARKIRENDSATPIVFLTSHTEMALEGYEVNAFRFLRKPVEDGKLLETLEDLKVMRAGNKGIIIRSEGEEIVIAPSEVLFIESDNNNVRIVTTSGTYTTRMKLTDSIDMFNNVSDTIRRVHRCTAVNMMHVGRIKEKEAVLDNGNVVAISRSLFQSFKNELYSYVKRTAR